MIRLSEFKARNLASYIPGLGRLLGDDSKEGPRVNIAPVEVHNVESSPEKRSRTLKQLIKANHTNHAVIYHNLQFDNHLPHILSSAYLLGANELQLQTIYDEQAKELSPWEPSPAELSSEDWRDFLGDKRYQRAFLDFFEDQFVVEHNYLWKNVVDEYMFSGKKPLSHCLIGGLGHPLIHLGYAYEMDSKEIAMEALSMTASQYNFLHKYVDDASYTKPSEISSTSVLDLLDKMSHDKRLTGLFEQPGFSNFESVFQDHEDLIMEYWNAWSLETGENAHTLVEQFQQSQEAAVALFIATVAPGTHAYNFFLVHLLTTSHAVRILLPFVPARVHIVLLRQWWLLAASVYMALLCPKIDWSYNEPSSETPDNGENKKWEYVVDRAIRGPHCTDSHFVKAVRALREASRTWGDSRGRYLSAAVRFVDDFQGWEFE